MNKVCQACSKTYYVRAYRSDSKFCSQECQNHKQYKRIDLICKGCEQVFTVSKSRKDKVFCSFKCKFAKCKTKEQKWKSDKNAQLKYKYGIGLTEVYLMHMDQSSCCAICNKHQSVVLGNTLSVDHDHSTGKVRGLLCDPCNMALGSFEDSISSLNNAISYLDGANCR